MSTVVTPKSAGKKRGKPELPKHPILVGGGLFSEVPPECGTKYKSPTEKDMEEGKLHLFYDWQAAKLRAKLAEVEQAKADYIAAGYKVVRRNAAKELLANALSVIDSLFVTLAKSGLSLDAVNAERSKLKQAPWTEEQYAAAKG